MKKKDPVATQFLTMAQLRQRWGDCSHMFIERKLKDDPTFPRPYRLGEGARPHRMWSIDEISAYERSRVSRT